MTDGGDCNIPMAFLKKRGDIKYLLCILNHISVILSVILFGHFYGLIWREGSGSVIEGPRVRASPASLRCVLDL